MHFKVNIKILALHFLMRVIGCKKLLFDLQTRNFEIWQYHRVMFACKHKTSILVSKSQISKHARYSKYVTTVFVLQRFIFEISRLSVKLSCFRKKLFFLNLAILRFRNLNFGSSNLAFKRNFISKFSHLELLKASIF